MINVTSEIWFREVTLEADEPNEGKFEREENSEEALQQSRERVKEGKI